MEGVVWCDVESYGLPYLPVSLSTSSSLPSGLPPSIVHGVVPTCRFFFPKSPWTWCVQMRVFYVKELSGGGLSAKPHGRLPRGNCGPLTPIS